MKKLLHISLASIILFAGCKKDPDNNDFTNTADKYDHEVATGWMNLELRLIRTTPGYTPPVAARALGYTGLALYETVVAGMPGYKTAAEALGYSYSLPTVGNLQRYNWSVAANVAMKAMLENLFESTSITNKQAIDSMYKAMLFDLQPMVDADVTSRSEAFGNTVAAVIFDWSKTDKGHQGYNSGFPASYVPPAGPGYWVPTPPAFQAIPLLPYWGSNRAFLAKNVTGTCIPPQPMLFSEDTNSAYYLQALEVYNITKNITPEEKNIALFWADGGNTITPPGHNMNLATQMLVTDGANLAKAAEVYLRMGLAVSDAFVACWKGKYLYNTMRPVTYIRKNIDASWLPIIATPPFPEYGSGHSTGSGAAAEVLTAMFGDNRSFTDHSHDNSGFAPRTFANFYEAGEEAAVSRLYGGIHFKSSNEKALECGKEIGRNIVAISLK